jgi:hypothetical protein
MNKQFIYLTSILISAMTVAVVASAQDASIAANNTTLNNNTPLNLDVAGQSLQNLSTVNSQTVTVAPISEMAGAAPLVAAGAASAQVASEPADSYKIGSSVGGIDPFNPKHVDVEPLSLGIATKPMRDTGKMFFVCDIV